MENVIVKFKNVTLAFNHKKVLDNVSFELKQRQDALLVGSSGAGKTTILKLMLGLIKPDAGQIILMDKDINKLHLGSLNEIRQKFGLVFQSGALFDSLTVEENVGFFLRENLKLDEGEIKKRVSDILRFLKIEDAADQYPDALSGGMIKRVAIARVVVAYPKVLLYDQPVDGLDPATSRKVVSLVKNLRDLFDHTSLIVTHEINYFTDIIRRCLVLDMGKIVYDGKPDESVFDHLGKKKEKSEHTVYGDIE